MPIPRPFGLAHFSMVDVPPPALVGIASRVGYPSIGLRLRAVLPGTPGYEIPAGSGAMRDMRSQLSDAGITVNDVEFLTIDEGFDASGHEPLLASAAELGAKRVTVCGDDADRGRLAANFAALCDHAAGYGLDIDMEIMTWRSAGTLDAVSDVVARAGRPNGAILIDALHLDRTGAAPADLDRLPAGTVRHVQLCDAPAARPETTEAIIAEARGGRLPPGEGALPLRDLLAHLADDVVLSVEVPNAGADPEDHALRVYDATRRLLAACAENEN